MMNISVKIALITFVLFGVVVTFTCSGCSAQTPALWRTAVDSTNSNWVFTWRAVDGLIERASKSQIDEFVQWTPSCSVTVGGNEDLFLFLWIRLADRGKADLDALMSKSRSCALITKDLLNLYSTGDHKFLIELTRSIETHSDREPYSLEAIRAAGLVPKECINETMTVLQQYVDLSRGVFRATGIYGEEIAEMESLLLLRKEANRGRTTQK
jgi:hypothetical protein